MTVQDGWFMASIATALASAVFLVVAVDQDSAFQYGASLFMALSSMQATIRSLGS